MKQQLNHPLTIHIQREKSLKNPATRQDLEALSKWTDLMVYKLYKDPKLTSIEVYEKLQIIYSAALLELFRQISIENNERALLFQKIWQSYQTLFSKAYQEITKEKKKEQKENLVEINRVHKMYTKEIGQLNELIEKNEKDKQQITEQWEKTKYYVYYLKKQRDNLGKKF